jgi:hypothetical protein
MRLRAAFAVGVLALTPLLSSAPRASAAAPPVPRFSHVVELFLENENATATWESTAAAPHLAQLRTTGAYIPNFYGVGHASLDNYEAAFGAVEPTAQGKADCLGMPYGSCIFPANVPTIATLLDEQSLSWKVYSEGMEGAPGGHPCLHAPSRSLPDPYQGPGSNGYATRHNPAPWFDSILTKGTNESYCQAHSIDLTHLSADLASPSTLPAFSFIEPDTCHDGHDTQSLGGCALDPEGPSAPNGVAAIDAWLPGFVHQVVSSPAWDDHSLLFITFDEASTADTSGCKPCADTSAGGRIGALAISPLIQPGLTSAWQGDHYGFLNTLESSWGLPSLQSRAASPAAAKTVHDADPGVTPLTDVWTAGAAAPKSAAPAAPAHAAAASASAPNAAAGNGLPSTGPSPSLWLPALALAGALALRRTTRRAARRAPRP